MIEFESITNPIMMLPNKRSTHITIVRTGVWKFHPTSGGQGRSGRRKARGYKKGFGYGGSRPTPAKALGRKKEEKKA
jgi:hypothetical protein